MKDEDREVIEAVNRRRKAERIRMAQAKLLKAERAVKGENQTIAFGWVFLAIFVVGCEILKTVMEGSAFEFFQVAVLIPQVAFSILIVIFIFDHRKTRKRLAADHQAARQRLAKEQAR